MKKCKHFGCESDHSLSIIRKGLLLSPYCYNMIYVTILLISLSLELQILLEIKFEAESTGYKRKSGKKVFTVLGTYLNNLKWQCRIDVACKVKM